jgi:hypothetical protein
LITLPPGDVPDEADATPAERPPPSSIGRLLGASLIAPAVLFSGIGLGVEKLASAFAQKRRGPDVRVTRTRQ